MSDPEAVTEGTGGQKMAAYTQAELGLDPLSKYQEVEREYRQKLTEPATVEDESALGWAHLAIAWAVEKQGQGNEALERAELAKSHLKKGGDIKRYSEACHSRGVWEFHHSHKPTSTADLERAAQSRLGTEDYLGGAQSWHNLGYVQLKFGRVSQARTSYNRALSLLETAGSSGDEDLRRTAYRQRGFVYSHQAYLAALHDDPDEAFEGVVRYLHHYESTASHREPVLAYVAAAICVARGKSIGSTEESVLSRLTHTDCDAKTLFEFAVKDAEGAMMSSADTGTGRRAYLGSWILALSEAANWHFLEGRADEAAPLKAKALELAHARGWGGEAVRVQRIGRGDRREMLEEVHR